MARLAAGCLLLSLQSCCFGLAVRPSPHRRPKPAVLALAQVASKTEALALAAGGAAGDAEPSCFLRAAASGAIRVQASPTPTVDEESVQYPFATEAAARAAAQALRALRHGPSAIALLDAAARGRPPEPSLRLPSATVRAGLAGLYSAQRRGRAVEELARLLGLPTSPRRIMHSLSM